MEVERAILDQVFQESPCVFPRHAFLQFNIGILTHPVIPDEEVQFFLAYPYFGDVDMNKSDFVVLEFLLALSAFANGRR